MDFRAAIIRAFELALRPDLTIEHSFSRASQQLPLGRLGVGGEMRHPDDKAHPDEWGPCGR